MNLKKVLAGISAFAVMLTAGTFPEYDIQLLPMTVSAEDTNENNTAWSLSGDGVLTVSGTGNMKDYGNQSGEELSPFFNKEDIKAVVIEKGVTSIGDNAFFGCKNIESVTISDTVVSIGEKAFQQCEKLNGVVIPESVSEIKQSAFYSCKALDTITIPETMTKYGAGAFFNTPYYRSHTNEDGTCVFPNNVLITGDDNIEELVIPPEIKVVAGGAFMNSKAVSVTINADCAVNELAFYNCDSLTTVDFKGKCRIDSFGFYDCGALETVTFDAGCVVDEGAFYRCDALAAVDVNSDCDFKRCAFYMYKALKTVNINASCTIRESAFYRCDALTTVNIDADCNIENSAFNKCSSLTSVHISGSSFNPSMFLQCDALTDFTYKRQPLTYSISDNADNKANIAKTDTIDSYEIEYDTFDNITSYEYFGKLDRLQETVEPSGNIYAVYGGEGQFYIIPKDPKSASVKITNEGFTFGGAVIGNDGFVYAVWGRSIPNEVINKSLEEENLIVCKYDMTGKLVKSLGLKVKDTEAQFPFDAGNANLRYKNGVLGVFFNTEWLESKTNDGLNHQGSEFAAINADTMTLLDFSNWEGSHSFGVSLIETEYGFAGAQKGDANPRSICINRYFVDDNGNFTFNNKKYDTMFTSSGQYSETGSHQNDTHYYMGGFAMSRSTYAVTGKSERFYTSGNYAVSGLKTDKYDVFVKIADQSFFDSAAADCAGEDRIDEATGKTENKNVIWLTECNASEKAGNVKIAVLEDGSYCVLWEKFINNMFDSIRYVIMDECGNILRKETGIYGARLSNTSIQPIVQGSTLTWAVAYADNNTIDWYSVDINKYDDVPDKYKELKEYMSENNINVSLTDGNYGTCGTSAYWVYDAESSSLYICGNGKVNIYGAESPWEKFKASVKSVFIGEGITVIDDDVFSYFSSLENVSLPKTLKKIGKMAFNYCAALKEIVLPENMEELGEYAFLDCNNLSSVTALSKNMKVGECSLGYRFKNESKQAYLKFYGYKGTEFEAYANGIGFKFYDIESPEPAVTTAVTTEITVTETTTVSSAETTEVTSVSTAETTAETTITTAEETVPVTAETTTATTTATTTTAAATTSKAVTTTAVPVTTAVMSEITTTLIPVTTTFVTVTTTVTTTAEVTSNPITTVKTTITTKTKPVTTKRTTSAVETNITTIPEEHETTVTTTIIPVTTTENTNTETLPVTTTETAVTSLPVTTIITETAETTAVSSETVPATANTTATDMTQFTTTVITVTTTVTTTLPATTAAAETTLPETITSITTITIPVTTTSVTSVTTLPETVTTAAATETTTAVTTKPVLRGDISGNGKIDLYDAIEIAKYIIGKRKFNEEEFNIADFTGDGKVDLYDAIGIAKYMIKKK